MVLSSSFHVHEMRSKESERGVDDVQAATQGERPPPPPPDIRWTNCQRHLLVDFKIPGSLHMSKHIEVRIQGRGGVGLWGWGLGAPFFMNGKIRPPGGGGY